MSLTFTQCVADTGVPGTHGLMAVKAQHDSLGQADDGQSVGQALIGQGRLQATDVLQGEAAALPQTLGAFTPVLVDQHQQAVCPDRQEAIRVLPALLTNPTLTTVPQYCWIETRV